MTRIVSTKTITQVTFFSIRAPLTSGPTIPTIGRSHPSDNLKLLRIIPANYSIHRILTFRLSFSSASVVVILLSATTLRELLQKDRRGLFGVSSVS